MSRNRHEAGFRGVSVLSVATSGPHQEPAIFVKHFNDITDFHGPTLLSAFASVKALIKTLTKMLSRISYPAVGSGTPFAGFDSALTRSAATTPPP